MGRFLFLSLGLLVVAFSLQGIGAVDYCPNDWISFGPFCYKIVKEPKTWKDAEMFCREQQEGGHLASIQSKSESALMFWMIFHSFFFSSAWIGLNAPQKTRTWEWSDGSRLRYTSWEKGEPNNLDDKEFCVELSKESRYLQWRDVDCESKLFFICKLQKSV